MTQLKEITVHIPDNIFYTAQAIAILRQMEFEDYLIDLLQREIEAIKVENIEDKDHYRKRVSMQ